MMAVLADTCTCRNTDGTKKTTTAAAAAAALLSQWVLRKLTAVQNHVLFSR
jgi:hypothetical protein